MKRTALVLGLSLALAAAPAAFAAPPGQTTTGPSAPSAGKPETKPVAPQQAKRGKVLVLVRACVTADATAGAPLAATVLSSNAHAKRAGLKKATEFTAGLDGTKITLVGKARKQEGTTVKLPRLGSFENLDRGDVVTLRIRVARTPRGTDPAQWATFPSWTSVVDNGPIRPVVCPTTTPTAPAAT